MESFKRWLLLQEIHHVSVYEDGELVPFEVDGEEVIAVDMKFEHYPEEELKKQLSHIDSKFYGKLPNQDLYLVRSPGKQLYLNLPLTDSLNSPQIGGTEHWPFIKMAM